MTKLDYQPSKGVVWQVEVPVKKIHSNRSTFRSSSKPIFIFTENVKSISHWILIHIQFAAFVQQCWNNSILAIGTSFRFYFLHFYNYRCNRQESPAVSSFFKMRTALMLDSLSQFVCFHFWSGLLWVCWRVCHQSVASHNRNTRDSQEGEHTIGQ